MSQSSFVDVLLPSGFGRNDRLEAINALIDWSPLSAMVSPVHTGETGRPPFSPLSMFKALLLQQWYGLSDPGLEEALMDRVSFRRFCSFSLEINAPDETTICRFRNALKAAGLGEALFVEINRQLEAGGFLVKAGTLIDATLVRSSARTPPSHSSPEGEHSRSTVDPDASWTRNGVKRTLFFGYKLHIGVDQGSGLIRSRLLTTARVYESEVADSLIMGDERAVYADKAYEKKERRQALRERGIKDRIQHRRHKYLAQLPYWQRIRNILIGRVRGAVERTFSVLKRTYGCVRHRYRGMTANAFHMDLIIIAHNLRQATRPTA